MKHFINHSKLALGQVDRQHVQATLFVITIILFVIGAGAPASTGGH